MRGSSTFLIVAAVVALLVGQAAAHWDPGDPYKTENPPQLPDLSETGMDVDNFWSVLADDFMCAETGPILDVHIWGSWADDILPGPGPAGDPNRNAGQVGFRLSLHTDLPVGHPENPYEYSIPGPEICQAYFDIGSVQWRLYKDEIREWWYDPATGNTYFPGDHECYQYNFVIDDPCWFQEEGQIYWLDVEALPFVDPGTGEPTGTFGWKTSLDHWNDDAVYWDKGGPGPWVDLHYPAVGWDFDAGCDRDHPLAGQSIDLAFVITPEPATLSFLALGGLALIRRRR